MFWIVECRIIFRCNVELFPKHFTGGKVATATVCCIICIKNISIVTQSRLYPCGGKGGGDVRGVKYSGTKLLFASVTFVVTMWSSSEEVRQLGPSLALTHWMLFLIIFPLIRRCPVFPPVPQQDQLELFKHLQILISTSSTAREVTELFLEIPTPLDVSTSEEDTWSEVKTQFTISLIFSGSYTSTDIADVHVEL